MGLIIMKKNKKHKDSNESQKPESPTYEDLGVSHQKEDVHAAIENVDQGLYPHAFCKIVTDLANNSEYCSIMHADGAGTKSALAYMMYKETENLDYFKGIVHDAVVMNVDDVLCSGVDASATMMLSNTIGRNKKIIPGAAIATIINEYDDYIAKLNGFGLQIDSCGGETADVGDLVRTLMLDCTLVARLKRSKVVDPRNIKDEDVIVGLSSFGKTSYEDLAYNSGIGSNGLTLARHGVLEHKYFEKFPECYSPELDENLVFFGKHDLQENLPNTPITVGQAILSPTRTYSPVLIDLFKIDLDRKNLHAIYHNTGGGQSKCLKFGEGIHYVKNNMFDTPPFFSLIQKSSGTEWKEMYQVFNMGHRMEIICPRDFAEEKVLPVCKKYDLDAKIVGYVEKNQGTKKNTLTIESSEGKYFYH